MYIGSIHLNLVRLHMFLYQRFETNSDAFVFIVVKMYVLCFRYKILFLDVLFPLDVQKIIFVDADQVNSRNVILLQCMCYS